MDTSGVGGQRLQCILRRAGFDASRPLPLFAIHGGSLFAIHVGAPVGVYQVLPLDLPSFCFFILFLNVDFWE